MTARPERHVLTGGPCSGKTNAKTYLHAGLLKLGVETVFTQEAATFIINAPLDPAKLSKKKLLAFQELILQTQLHFEDKAFKRALAIKSGLKKVMICDRGLMDGLAYTDKRDFENILARNRLTIVDARDRRYDAVFHLISAADGRPEYYSNKNNAARFETAEEAVAADKRTQAVWLGHEHLRVIDNSTLFQGKMGRLLKAVKKALGIPMQLEIERKFLVGSNAMPSLPVPYMDIDIQQTYLVSGRNEVVRVRQRGQIGHSLINYLTRKRPTASPLASLEKERIISARECASYLRQADSHRDTIKKIRKCFLWENQYFHLDYFLAPARVRGVVILEIELTEENDRVKIPPWLGRVMEVTEDPAYKSYNMAQR